MLPRSGNLPGVFVDLAPCSIVTAPPRLSQPALETPPARGRRLDDDLRDDQHELPSSTDRKVSPLGWDVDASQFPQHRWGLQPAYFRLCPFESRQQSGLDRHKPLG